MRVVILLSGGIDSMACVNFYLQQGYDVECIFCNYGQPGAVSELIAASKIAEHYQVPLRIIETTNISIPESGEICGRNALLVQQALCCYGYGTYKIILGIHDGTGYADCSQLFVDHMNRLIDCYANGTIILEAPFLNWLKPEIISYCKANSLPVHFTYSCEAGKVPPCGHCLSCLDRKEYLDEQI